MVGGVVLISVLHSTTSAQTAPSAPADPGWPREVASQRGSLTYYQPQLDDWKDYQEVTARLAFSLVPSEGTPVLGVASVKAKTQTDLDARVVVVKSIEVTETRFPSLDSAGIKPMDRLFRHLFPTVGMTVSLDRVLGALERSKMSGTPAPLRSDPPPIFVSERRAILLFVDGKPAQAPVDSTSPLTFVVNTNWPLFYEANETRYYLLDDKTWQSAEQLAGPWAVTTSLPKSFASLPAGEEFADVRRALPARPATSPVKPVFYTAVPGELIEFSGKPAYADIPPTRLVYAKNTESDLFVHKDQRRYYVLLSGRWFRADSLGGPWTYAGGDLPADFARIPRNGPKSDVLASVPGTQDAADAVLLAQIPVSATVNRAEAEKSAQVVYDGQPTFAPIQATSVSYATNTSAQVILVEHKYYWCKNGVWFVASSATGPWKTATVIPASIYTIPPSAPVYNVTYVTVSDPSPTTVTVSYTSGYTGAFLLGVGAGMTVVYGTGWYYPPYFYYPPRYAYPIYRPYPYTYAVGARYNPYTGGYGVGRAVYGPYGAAGGAAWYSPATGRYGRAATVQGPYGGRTVAGSYNPYTGVRSSTVQGSSPYAQWGSTAVQRGNDWAVSNRVTTAQGSVRHTTTSTGATAATVRGPGGQTTHVGTDANNNVYAGRDGNVYRRDEGGSWQKYDNGDWASISQPNQPRAAPASAGSQAAGVPSDVQRDATSRQRGADRQAGFDRANRGARSGGRPRPRR